MALHESLPRQAKCAGKLETAWWRDRELLWKEYAAHGSMRKAAMAHGVSARTLSDWWQKHDLPELQPGPKRTESDPAQKTPEGFADITLLHALKKLGDSSTITELANELDTSPARVLDSLERLGHEGYRVAEKNEAVKIIRQPVPSQEEHLVLFSGETYRFAIISDAHLNSKHCRLDELHMAYDMVVSEGITDVYNPGDIVAGRGIFKNQDHEIINHTFETQKEYAIANYPSRDGVVTKIISGNHDCEGDFGRAGADACKGVANERDDLEWCGMYAADFKLPNGAIMTMRHPMGGSSYAKSYKPQKFAESFEGGSKPAIALFGHWHNYEAGFHRNIYMLNCGTFEGYGGTLGLRVPLGPPAVGFIIAEATVGDDGSLVRFKHEWLPFFKGRRSQPV